MWTSGEDFSDFSEHCGDAASTEVILSALSHSDIAGKVTYWISPRTTNVAAPFRIQNTLGTSFRAEDEEEKKKETSDDKTSIHNTADGCKRVLLSPLFDFDFGDMWVLCLKRCTRNRNRKGEKEGHVSRNPL